MTMNGVFVRYRLLHCSYMNYFAFLWVEGHLPVRLPSFKVVKVFLEFNAIRGAVNCQVQKGII